MRFCFRSVTTDCVRTSWPRAPIFFYSALQCFFEHNFANVAKMYKTVLCFEMSFSLFFSRLYGILIFWPIFCANCVEVNVQNKNFFLSRPYTPKCLDSGRINRKLKKMLIAASTSAQNAPHVHSVSRSLAHWLSKATTNERTEVRGRRQCGRVDFVFKSTARFEIRFSLGYVRLLSARFDCFVAACLQQDWQKLRVCPTKPHLPTFSALIVYLFTFHH